MEEIDLIELLNYFKKKIGLIIIIMSAVGILGCIYTLFIQKPMYNSYTTVILSGSSSSSITQTDVTLNKNLISTYAEIVKSGRVLNQVIKELNLDISYELLSSGISVTSLNNTEIIKITVNNESADMAMKIANSTASVFTKEISSLYKMDNVSILDYATINESPYNINILKQLIIYILAGLVISLGTVFMIFYFDRTIKSVEQIEQKIKLPVLGSVQDISKGGKK
jgi:capsular polysaccharide biosynthesis protein